MTDIKATLDELRAMRASGAIKPTRDDAHEIDTPEGFWNNAIPSKHLGAIQSILDAAIEIAIEDQARIAELEAALADGGSVIKQFNYIMTGHSDYHLQQWIPAQEALAPLLRDGVDVEDAINAMCKAALGGGA
jgi:hypothetical protein